jgi:hypothetical protein
MSLPLLPRCCQESGGSLVKFSLDFAEGSRTYICHPASNWEHHDFQFGCSFPAAYRCVREICLYKPFLRLGPRRRSAGYHRVSARLVSGLVSRHRPLVLGEKLFMIVRLYYRVATSMVVALELTQMPVGP